ncbi:MAG TPA: DUF6029 family protein [Lentimicrobium sp.]|nr:DUF6029 family protein [Lentimicrobium sp.]
MRKLFFAVIALIITAGAASAQDLLSGKVSGNFQLDAQVYKADSAIGANEVKEQMLMNAFANLLYTQGNFNAGVRFESYLNPIQGYDVRYKGTGVPYWFASWEKESFGITVGHFYEQFGSGMTLRSYEERTLGYDNAIKGARIVFKPVEGITLKGLIGTQRFFWEQGPGLVRGVDGEIVLNDIFKKAFIGSSPRVTLGGNFVSKYEPSSEIVVGKNGDLLLILPENVAMASGRMNVNYKGFILDGEYAYKFNDPSEINGYIYKPGQSLLLQATYSKKGFGVILSGKVTDNMSFKSSRTEDGSVLDINYLPALTRQHAYSLSAMYPYATQPNGEVAIQGQLNYKFKKDSPLGGKYGTDVAVNFSRITSLKRTAINDSIPIGEGGTLGYKTDFFDFGDDLYFQDFNIEIQHKFNTDFKALVSWVNLNYNIDVIEGHTGEPMVKANIFIADATYKFSTKTSLKTELQHLSTKQDDGDWAQAMLELNFAPTWFITVMDQYNYGNENKDKRFHFPMVALGYTQDANRLQVSYGKQREGIICIGGVCRAVPASNGLTITLTSSF